MPEPIKADQEPKEGAQPIPEYSKSRRAFSRVRRELTEDEISQPAIHRLILDDIDRLEQEVAELTGFRDRYYVAEREKAVTEQKLKQHTASEILHNAALGVGFLFIGLAPSIWSQQPYGYLSVAGGSILIIGSLVAKRWAR